MKFGFYTLGCKVNLFETQALMQQATARGHELCSQNADAFIINTCSVTAISNHKNLRALHKIRRENPHAVIAACGCFAQTEPEKLKATGEIDLVCGTAARADVIALCEDAVRGRYPDSLEKFRTPGRTYELLPAGVPAGRTRALLKIEDGCDHYCTYCIIPYARGHVRSMPFDAAVSEAIRLSQSGVQEIMVTGIEISSYGHDLPDRPSLLALILAICQAVPNTQIRLGSLEPRTIDRAFCKQLSAQSNLRPHFHLSLQSGCDATLQRMKRRYSTAFFAERCAMLREFFPGCSITTDLIVGFPGETAAEFQQTADFITRCAFSDMHVFPYSIRPGTPAASMPMQVDDKEKAARATQIKQIAARMRTAYGQQWIGRTLPVLFEHPVRGTDCWSGHSDYCFSVQAAHPAISKNRILPVRITGLNDAGLVGEVDL